MNLKSGSLKVRDDSGIYWLDFTFKGKRYRETSHTNNRDLAIAWAERRVAQIYMEVMVSQAKERTLTDAIDAFLSITTEKKDRAGDLEKAAFFKTCWGALRLSEITREGVIELLAIKKTAATRNRYTSFLSAVMRNAKANGWVDSVPEFLRHKEVGRLNFFTTLECERLIANIKNETHRAAVILAIETGLRQGNIYGLRWNQVHLDRKLILIDGADTKGGSSLRIPLTDAAIEAITAMQGKHGDLVFGDTPINPRTFKTAMKNAGIAEGSFHTLRHTFASRHAMAGTPLLKLQKLGGWKTLECVLKYAHLSDEFLGE